MMNKYISMLLAGLLTFFTIHSFAKASICNINTCKNLTVPSAVKKIIGDGYEQINAIGILDGDYMIATTGSQVNKCSVLFPIEDNRINENPVDFHNNPFCNYAVINGRVVSSWKDNAKWYEDVYQVNGDKWELMFRDECVGCNKVKRTFFNDGLITSTQLLKDADDFNNRTTLLGVILIKKSDVFRTANPTYRTKSFLIKGDIFELADISSDGNYYQIRYLMKNGRILTGWIKANDFTLKTP